MIHNIPKPEISPKFTVEDIHKIRAWNYERLKDATPEERRADIEHRANRARQRMTRIRSAETIR